MDLHVSGWVVLAASPRTSGNSEHAAGLASACLRAAELPVDLLLLRDYTIAPCISCGLCSTLPGACALDPDRSGRPDDAAAIFACLRAAAGLVVISPVYFYGLPALFKALVDRSQRYWPQAGIRTDQSAKPAYAILPAGRMRGDRLFDGSLLTLRPFLHLLNFRLQDHLPLRGLNAPDALAGRPDLCARVSDWTSRIADATSCSPVERGLEGFG